jgi:pseudouridine-5'-phosphate glycosidase
VTISLLHVHEEVAEALGRGAPVVALESTLIAHGLPAGVNLEVAARIEAVVRPAGAVPATVALLDGQVHIGLDAVSLQRVATGVGGGKVGLRDVPTVLAEGVVGATTVASTAWLAHRAGIRVFATGGLGGVHREASRTFDESADLSALAATPITVVCAGVKSILDVQATLERLETLSVGLVGYGTDTFPGFYIRDTGLPVPARVNTPAQVAELAELRARLELPQALVVANPVPASSALDRALHDEVLATGLAALETAGVHGKDVTPFLLAWFHEHTAGASLQANIDLVLANAQLASQVALAQTAVSTR